MGTYQWFNIAMLRGWAARVCMSTEVPSIFHTEEGEKRCLHGDTWLYLIFLPLDD